MMLRTALKCMFGMADVYSQTGNEERYNKYKKELLENIQ